MVIFNGPVFFIVLCLASFTFVCSSKEANSCQTANILKSSSTLGTNKPALNIFPVSVQKNQFLKGLENAKPVWGECLGTTILGDIGEIEYIASEDEWAYYFDCNTQKNSSENALCKVGGQQCIATECVLQLKDLKFCIWLQGSNGELLYGMNQNSCFQEFAPKTAEAIKANLAINSPEKNADSQLDVSANAIKEVHRLDYACKHALDTEGPAAINTSTYCTQLKDAQKTMHESLSSLREELQKEQPQRQLNVVQQEQNKLGKLKQEAAEFQAEIDRKNKIASAAKALAVKREAQIFNLAKQKKEMERQELNADKKEQDLANQEKEAQIKEAKLQREKHAIIQAALAKELQAKELESLGRSKEEQTAKADLAKLMKKSDKLKADAEASNAKYNKAAEEVVFFLDLYQS